MSLGLIYKNQETILEERETYGVPYLVYPLLEETGEGIGFGLAGDLPAPKSLAELVAALSQRVDMSLAVTAGNVPEKIARVAYCTGSGASLMEEAEKSGADGGCGNGA